MMASKAAVEAFPNALSAMSATMTPFLYQTRTLTTLPWTRTRSLLRPQLCENISKRCFGSRSAQHSIEIKRVTTVRNPSSSQWTSDAAGNIFEELRDSRAIAEQPQENNGSVVRKVYEPEMVKADDIPWDTTEGDMDFAGARSDRFDDTRDDPFNDEDEIGSWRPRSNLHQGRTTTITPTERAAFETIFENIRKKSKLPHRNDGGDIVGDEISPDRKIKAKELLRNILGNATLENEYTRAEKEVVVNRYPPSLRALAAKAVGLTFDEAHFQAPEDETAMDNDQLEELRKPERDRVEARMRAARTDFELWSVMEEEVFSLVAQLGLDETPKEEIPLKKRSKKSNAKAKVPPPAPITELKITDNKASPLAIYGPLYPSYLLLGLRLLDRSFAKNSPLALSVLPRIKSLGLISHVLGASTQLYNELLLIHWYRYDDFRGVLNLLVEMENSGLDFDNDTLETVIDIMRMQSRTARGDRGETLQALWSLPEFAPGKFRMWRDKISAAIAEKESPV